MTISVKDDANSVNVDVEGLIKSASDAQSFKDAIESVSDKKKEVIINIIDSFAVTSSIIGYLRKKVQVDGLKLQIRVRDQRLYDLLDELNLISYLNVKKID